MNPNNPHSTSISVDTVDKVLCRIDFLIENCRLLAARRLYDKLLRLVVISKNCSDIESIRCKLDTRKSQLDQLVLRSDEIQRIIGECSNNYDNWTLGSEMFGVRSYYRVEEDGLLCVRMEGIQDIPIFEQIAVFYECSLYKEWVPFCKQSDLLKKISHPELVFHTAVSTPFMVRDMVLHAYASDCMMEHGAIAFMGRSVEEFEGVKIPPHPNPFFGCRADVKMLCGVVSIISPSTAKTVIIVKVNPRLALPQTIINFVMRQMAGVFLYFMQKQALRVASDPDCAHAMNVRANSDFYKNFLLPNVRAYCQLRGWEQVTIPVLGNEGIAIPGKDYSRPDLYEDTDCLLTDTAPNSEIHSFEKCTNTRENVSIENNNVREAMSSEL